MTRWTYAPYQGFFSAMLSCGLLRLFDVTVGNGAALPWWFYASNVVIGFGVTAYMMTHGR